jgi:hypothetical protein
LFKHKKNQIDGLPIEVDSNTQFNQIIEYFNREHQYEVKLLDTLRNKGEALNEKEQLLFNLLISKYESNAVDLKYLIRLRTRILDGGEITESEMSDLESLEELRKTNDVTEIEAMRE